MTKSRVSEGEINKASKEYVPEDIVWDVLIGYGILYKWNKLSGGSQTRNIS